MSIFSNRLFAQGRGGNFPVDHDGSRARSTSAGDAVLVEFEDDTWGPNLPRGQVAGLSLSREVLGLREPSEFDAIPWVWPRYKEAANAYSRQAPVIGIATTYRFDSEPADSTLSRAGGYAPASTSAHSATVHNLAQCRHQFKILTQVPHALLDTDTRDTVQELCQMVFDPDTTKQVLQNHIYSLTGGSRNSCSDADSNVIFRLEDYQTAENLIRNRVAVDLQHCTPQAVALASEKKTIGFIKAFPTVDFYVHPMHSAAATADWRVCASLGSLASVSRTRVDRQSEGLHMAAGLANTRDDTGFTFQEMTDGELASLSHLRLVKLDPAALGRQMPVHLNYENDTSIVPPPDYQLASQRPASSVTDVPSYDVHTQDIPLNWSYY